VPTNPGVAGVAANFVLHVSRLIDRNRAWRSGHVQAPTVIRSAANEQAS